MILKKMAMALLAVGMTAGVAAAAGDADKVLNISYVKSPFNLQSIVMKRQGLLEKELEPLGVKVVWHEITSGAQQAQAMAAGSLDVGGVMNTTSIQMARGEGNPIKIVAGVSRPTGVFAIVGKKSEGQNRGRTQGHRPAPASGGRSGRGRHEHRRRAVHPDGHPQGFRRA